MHIKTALAEASVKTVFPIRCPECTWPIQNHTAEKVLTKEEMEGMWYWAKVFQEVPTFYCPIGTCGARIESPPTECSRGLRRAVKWHEGASFSHKLQPHYNFNLGESTDGWFGCLLFPSISQVKRAPNTHGPLEHLTEIKLFKNLQGKRNGGGAPNVESSWNGTGVAVI
ncbi:hypothetical protein FRC01_012336 [Tulasnella sp. 417]|nr:hypothetical protein FRC01_012336 [Tulasnella sp. 417]